MGEKPEIAEPAQLMSLRSVASSQNSNTNDSVTTCVPISGVLINWRSGESHAKEHKQWHECRIVHMYACL